MNSLCDYNSVNEDNCSNPSGSLASNDIFQYLSKITKGDNGLEMEANDSEWDMDAIAYKHSRDRLGYPILCRDIIDFDTLTESVGNIKRAQWKVNRTILSITTCARSYDELIQKDFIDKVLNSKQPTNTAASIQFHNLI